MSLKKRIKNHDRELSAKRQALHESLRPLTAEPMSAAMIGGVLVTSFVLGFLAQRLIVSPGKTLSSCARLVLSPLSFIRVF